MFDRGIKNLGAGLVLTASSVASAAPNTSSDEASSVADGAAMTSTYAFEDPGCLTLAFEPVTREQLAFGLGGMAIGAAATAIALTQLSGRSSTARSPEISQDELTAVREGVRHLAFEIGQTFNIDDLAAIMGKDGKTAPPADRFMAAINVWVEKHGLIAPVPESSREYQVMKDPALETEHLTSAGRRQITTENARELLLGRSVYPTIFGASPARNFESEVALVRIVNQAVRERTALRDLALDSGSLPLELQRICEPSEGSGKWAGKLRLSDDMVAFMAERLRQPATNRLVWRMACGVLPELRSGEASYFEDILPAAAAPKA